MKLKAKLKIVIDVLMTLALLFVSGYHLWGETAHEWVGAGLFILFIAHHLLNLAWYKNLFSGKFTPVRILQIAIDILLFTVMLIEMYSGIVLSRYVFTFLPIESGLMLARRLHILGAYWGILLMSLHLGLHWNMVLGMIRRSAGIKAVSKTRRALCFIAGLLIAGYGAVVFIERDFATYLLLKSEFVFLNYGEAILLFYIDYLALMGLCIFVTHYLSKLLRKLSKERGRSSSNAQ